MPFIKRRGWRVRTVRDALHEAQWKADIVGGLSVVATWQLVQLDDTLAHISLTANERDVHVGYQIGQGPSQRNRHTTASMLAASPSSRTSVYGRHGLRSNRSSSYGWPSIAAAGQLIVLPRETFPTLRHAPSVTKRTKRSITSSCAVFLCDRYGLQS